MDVFWFAIGWLSGVSVLSILFFGMLWLMSRRGGYKSYIDENGGKVTTYAGNFDKSV